MMHMKRLIPLFLCLVLLSGCGPKEPPAQIAATTLPVYEFTQQLCDGTGLTVTRLVTEEVSCLHDYSLNVRQVKAAEAAETIVISGAGLEEFLGDLLLEADILDASVGIELICPEEAHSHDHEDEHSHAHEHIHEEDAASWGHSHEGHSHDQDPHIWLSPINARKMAWNIYEGLCQRYPEHSDTFAENLEVLTFQLDGVYRYGVDMLAELSCRELITFHDGFAYLARDFKLEILEAVEEESGSEASARELIHLIEEVEHHSLPAIFTEKSGSVSAASIIARETGCGCYSLDMAMAGDSYFDAMYHNIDTLWEALG